MKKMENDKCIFCRDSDSAEHAVFLCPRSAQYRRMVGGTGRTLTADNFVDTALESNTNWRYTMRVVHKLVLKRERDMRTAQLNH